MYRLSILLLLVLTASCTRGTQSIHEFQIYEENGITVAETTGGPKYQVEIFKYEELFRLDQDESIEESLLYRATSFLMGDDGRLYVADQGNGRIAVFNANGSFSFSFGRTGRGPGDFSFPIITSVGKGIVTISDGGLRRTSLFTTDGELLKILTYPQIGTDIPTIYPGPEESTVLIANHSYHKPTETNWSSRATVISSDGDTICYLETPQRRAWKRSRIGIVSVLVTTPFKSLPTIGYIPEKGFLVSVGDEPILTLYSFDGNPQRIFRLHIQKKPVSDQERADILHEAREAIANAQEGISRERAKKQLELLEIPSHKDYWMRPIMDDSYFIWAREPNIGIGNISVRQRFLIISPDGEYLGDTVFPEVPDSTIQLMPSKGHMLLTFEDPETGQKVFSVYSIRSVVEGLEYP